MPASRFRCFLVLCCGGLLTIFAGPLDSTSHPDNDPADSTIWPNQTSRANSDQWLVENHDRIRQMRPRLLLLNFSQEASREKLEQLKRDLLAAIKESSRYHGYRDADAPAFLDYQLFKFVDWRDANKAKGNCDKVPVKASVTDPRAINMDYNAFFTEKCAPHYGVPDPKNTNRFLRLDELVDRGYVHEVWFFGEATPEVRALECVEEKPQRAPRVHQRFARDWLFHGKPQPLHRRDGKFRSHSILYEIFS